MATYDTTAPEGRFTPKLSEWLVYGSESHGRFETVKPISSQLLITWDGLKFDDSLFTRRLRYREYELKDHLGNVRVTFSDLKLQPQPSIPQTDSFRLDLLSVNNYYPFGMREPERNWTKPGRATYRYMYNGKEQDRDIKGEGNSYDYGARFYDPRIGRFLSLDPKIKEYPNLSPFSSFENNPIYFNDPDGKDGEVTIKGNTITVKANIAIFGSGASQAVATQMQQNIMKDWNNNGNGWKYTNPDSKKQYNVKFDVHVYLYNPKNPTDVPFILDEYNPFSRNNYVELTSSSVRASVIGGDEGKWESSPSQRYGGIAQWSHELGHLLGLDERYYDTKHEDGNRYSKSFPGWEGNIMSGTVDIGGWINGPGRVEQRNVEAIVVPFVKQYEDSNNKIENNAVMTNAEKKSETNKEFKYEIDENNPSK